MPTSSPTTVSRSIKCVFLFPFITSSQFTVPINTIRKVFRGKNTKVFQQKKLEGVDGGMCFTICHGNPSKPDELSLIADNHTACGLWVTGLRHLMVSLLATSWTLSSGCFNAVCCLLSLGLAPCYSYSYILYHIKLVHLCLFYRLSFHKPFSLGLDIP